MPCASFRQCLYPQLFTEGDLTLNFVITGGAGTNESSDGWRARMASVKCSHLLTSCLASSSSSRRRHADLLLASAFNGVTPLVRT